MEDLDHFSRTNRAAFSFQLGEWHVLSEELLINRDEELEADLREAVQYHVLNRNEFWISNGRWWRGHAARLMEQYVAEVHFM